MSQHTATEITCPNCGNKQQITMWNSLNGDLDPDAKQRLIDGTFFVFKCEKCGNEANIVYDMLYHDMEHNVMVYFVQPERVEETQKQMEIAQTRMSEIAGNALNTRNRIVTSQNRLREKAIIFNAGLDDRIIELIKLFCWFEVTKKMKDIPDDALYFYIDNNGEYKVEVFGNVATCNITKELYQNITDQFTPILDVIGEQYIIDNNFAGNVFVLFNKHARGEK